MLNKYLLSYILQNLTLKKFYYMDNTNMHPNASFERSIRVFFMSDFLRIFHLATQALNNVKMC